MKQLYFFFTSEFTGPKLESFCAHWKKIVDLAVSKRRERELDTQRTASTFVKISGYYFYLSLRHSEVRFPKSANFTYFLWFFIDNT